MFSKIKSFLFINKGTGQILAKNTFWLGFGEIIGRLLKAIIIFYVIRILSVEEWGIFSYALSICGFFMIFSDIGLSSTLTKEASIKGDKIPSYISTSFILKITINILLFLIIVIIAPLFSNNLESTKLIPLIAILLISDSMREFIFSIGRAMEKMELEAFIRIFTNILIVLSTFVLVTKYVNAKSIAIGYTLGSIAGLLITIFIFRKELRSIIKNFSKSLVKPIISTAWPLAIILVFSSIMSSIDSIMIGAIKGVNEVGYYATSQRLIAFLYILPGLITSSILPTLSKEKENIEKIRNIMNLLLKIIFMITVPLVIGGILTSQEFIPKIFGAEYIKTINIFNVSIVSILFVFPTMLWNTVAFIFNKHKEIVRISIFGTVLNIILNLILIPKMGALGASITTVASQLFITIFVYKKVYTLLDIKILRGLNKILFSSLIMMLFTITMSILNLNIFIIIGISITIYSSLLFILKEEIFSKINLYKSN